MAMNIQISSEIKLRSKFPFPWPSTPVHDLKPPYSNFTQNPQQYVSLDISNLVAMCISKHFRYAKKNHFFSWLEWSESHDSIGICCDRNLLGYMHPNSKLPIAMTFRTFGHSYMNTSLLLLLMRIATFLRVSYAIVTAQAHFVVYVIMPFLFICTIYTIFKFLQ